MLFSDEGLQVSERGNAVIKAISVILVVLGLGVAANFVISGPHAFAWGWVSVSLGCLAGGLLVWGGVALWKKKKSGVPRRR